MEYWGWKLVRLSVGVGVRLSTGLKKSHHCGFSQSVKPQTAVYEMWVQIKIKFKFKKSFNNAAFVEVTLRSLRERTTKPVSNLTFFPSNFVFVLFHLLSS